MSSFPWGAAIAGAGSIAGGLIGASGSDDYRNTRRRGNILLDQQQEMMRRLFGHQETVLKQRHEDVGGHYTTAHKRLDRSLVEGKADILEREKVAGGAISGAQAGMGYTGSADANLRRALSSDTSRAIGSLRSDVGQMRSQLDVSQAAAEAESLGALAEHYGLRYGAEAQIAGARQGLWTGVGAGGGYNPMAGIDWAGIGMLATDLFEGNDSQQTPLPPLWGWGLTGG